MNRQADIFLNEDFAGTLEKNANRYIFRYEKDYLFDATKKAISLTLPKNKQEYQSQTLFPFFFNMLPEGVNKSIICRQLQLDENDFFSLLLEVAFSETIGAVTVRKSST
ncbi:MAG: HipA N-terminal domain-containing protein [Verrucomicrobia bacterium]|nr:HipA N-terminal domain-containing protein [Cytophagales bacterium]